MKKMRRATAIAASALALLLIVGILYGLGANRRYHVLQTGATEGFPIQGTYVDGPDESPRMRFVVYQSEDSRTMLWQIHPVDGNDARNGTASVTDDPNVYTLFDADGSECGLVHVAYVLGPSDGLLYLQVDGTWHKLSRKLGHAFLYGGDGTATGATS